MAAASRKTTVARTASRSEPADEVGVIPQSFDASVAGPVGEIQQSLRAAAEKSLVDSRAAFVAIKATADEAVSALEVSLAAARDSRASSSRRSPRRPRISARSRRKR